MIAHMLHAWLQFMACLCFVSCLGIYKVRYQSNTSAHTYTNSQTVRACSTITSMPQEAARILQNIGSSRERRFASGNLLQQPGRSETEPPVHVQRHQRSCDPRMFEAQCPTSWQFHRSQAPREYLQTTHMKQQHLGNKVPVLNWSLQCTKGRWQQFSPRQKATRHSASV